MSPTASDAGLPASPATGARRTSLRREIGFIGLFWAGAIAVFSLVIYYWAMLVALPRERIQKMIDEVVLPEEDFTV